MSEVVLSEYVHTPAPTLAVFHVAPPFVETSTFATPEVVSDVEPLKLIVPRTHWLLLCDVMELVGWAVSIFKVNAPMPEVLPALSVAK